MPSGKISSTGLMNQESEPSFLNISATSSMASLSINGSPHSLQKKIGKGIPHLRCLEIHQSLRSRTIEEILSCPQVGIHLTFCISFSAFSLKSSIEQNHCSVALKITGFLHLQQCGY